MSSHQQQAFVEAPLHRVWDLVGDPRKHPEWWPRILEVDGARFDEGANYAQVTKTPFGKRATELRIDRLDDLREIEMTCQTTGTKAHWTLTEARGGTFVDVELGVIPTDVGGRVFDTLFGRRYFRRWAEESLVALKAKSS